MEDGRLARPAGRGRPASTNKLIMACAFPIAGATIRSSEVINGHCAHSAHSRCQCRSRIRAAFRRGAYRRYLCRAQQSRSGTASPILRIMGGVMKLRLVFVLVFTVLAVGSLSAQQPGPAAQCIECHSKITPNIVSDWKLSKHSQVEVTCVSCHGDQHTSPPFIRPKWSNSGRENTRSRGRRCWPCRPSTGSRWR